MATDTSTDDIKRAVPRQWGQYASGSQRVLSSDIQGLDPEVCVAQGDRCVGGFEGAERARRRSARDAGSLRVVAAAAQARDDAMVRPCITCGVLVENASRCALHAKRPRNTPGRAGQAAFRDEVVAAAEYRCQAVENGTRCDVTDSALLEAHHLKRLRDRGTNDTSNGVCLCRHNDRKVEAASPSRST